MDKDLSIAGSATCLVVGLGLVKGQTKRELNAVGTAISIVSGVLLLVRLFGR